MLMLEVRDVGIDRRRWHASGFAKLNGASSLLRIILRRYRRDSGPRLLALPRGIAVVVTLRWA